MVEAVPAEIQFPEFPGAGKSAKLSREALHQSGHHDPEPSISKRLFTKRADKQSPLSPFLPSPAETRAQDSWFWTG